VDGEGVDIMAEVLHIGAQILMEVFRSAVIGDQDTDVHSVRNLLGTEALEVLAYGCVGLPNLIWVGQGLFIKSEIRFEGEEDCRLVNSADSSEEFPKIEALDCCCFEISPSFNCED